MSRLRKVLLVLCILIAVLAVFILIPEKCKELKTQHFSMKYSKDIASGDVATLANSLEQNYQRIGNDLQCKPSQMIDVRIYSKRWRYIKATGNWGASGSIEGMGKLHFIFDPAQPFEIRKVAIHEFTHTVVLKMLLDQNPGISDENFMKKFNVFPVWLWEAVSVYEAAQFRDPKSLAYLQNGKYPSLAELSDRMKGGKIYECGYTLVEYILSEYGKENLIALIANYGNVQTTFHVSEAKFSKGWYDFISRKYLGKLKTTSA
jgi:hypothetical protein